MMAQRRGQTALSYRSVRIGLRAPRVVIVVPSDDLWISHCANALYTASRTWGGSGFVVAPSDPDVSDVLLRAVAAFDPDYVVGLAYTNSDRWALGVAEPPTGPESGKQYDEAVLAGLGDQAGPVPNSDRIADAASVYRLDHGEDRFRDVTSLGPSRASRSLRKVEEPPTLSPIVEAPTVPSGVVGLSLALRLGYAHRPTVPYEDDATASEAGAAELILNGQPTPRAPGHQPFDAAPAQDAWQLTEIGLGWISRRVPRPERLFVLGATLEDFCLALAWDRMHGHSSGSWVAENLTSQDKLDSFANALSTAAWDARHRAGRVLVTSCSMPVDVVRKIVQTVQTQMTRVFGTEEIENQTIVVLGPEQVKFRPTHHLAFVPDDYDIVETLPVDDHSSESVEVMTAVPVHVPHERAKTKASRPDWQVDVDLGHLPAPRQRGLPARALLSRENDWTTARASRAGVSYSAHDMGFVDEAASLRQSIATPKLRYPGLREWINQMVGDDHVVSPSDAGRSAHVSAQLWGGRMHLLDSFSTLRPLFAEFTRRVTSDATGFPERDGLSITGHGVVLSFPGCRRALASAEPQVLRRQVDQLLADKVLRRGVVLRCPECSQRSFVAIDGLQQRNECQRCGNDSDLAAPTWGDADEPAWYYSLHPAVTKLMSQNGDVPILGAAFLRQHARNYTDDSELQWTKKGESRPKWEIDLIAVADDEVIVAEAKSNPASTGRRNALDKLVEVAAQLRADAIALLSGGSGPWNAAQVSHLQGLIEHRRWIDGRRPALIRIAGLTENGLSATREELVSATS